MALRPTPQTLAVLAAPVFCLPPADAQPRLLSMVAGFLSLFCLGDGFVAR